MGILDENDLVAHQLPFAPEMVTLGQLLRQRGKSRFDLYRVPAAKSETKLVFGGDVMLGRSCAAKIQNGRDPFEGISSLIRQSSFAAANLECTISNLGVASNRYAFRAPAKSAQLLRQAGFDAMGLANNHALDFGPAALHDSAARLLKEQIQPVGVETPSRNACDPSFVSLSDGKKVALLAISAFTSSERVASLISEGSEQSTDRHFAEYCYRAKGSARETRTQLIVAVQREHLTEAERVSLDKRYEEIGRMLSGLIRRLRGNPAGSSQR